MRPLTSGVFQRLMAEALPEIDVLDVGHLLLNYVLSDPYVDGALVGGREARLGEPRFVELTWLEDGTDTAGESWNPLDERAPAGV